MVYLLIVFLSFLLCELEIPGIILFDIECLFGGRVVVLTVADVVVLVNVCQFVDQVVVCLLDFLFVLRVAHVQAR